MTMCMTTMYINATMGLRNSQTMKHAECIHVQKNAF